MDARKQTSSEKTLMAMVNDAENRRMVAEAHAASLEAILDEVEEWATRNVADGECFDGSEHTQSNLLRIIGRSA